jgi:hypothetical protein
MNDMTEEKLSILKKINNKIGLDNQSITKIIFVYCPPKVGSTSLVSSLRISGASKYKVLHIHDEKMLEVLTGLKGATIQDIIDFNVFLGREIVVIDIYREPLERKMSEFFGKLASYHFNTSIQNVERYSLERLSARFNSLFPHLANGDHYLEKYHDIVICPPSDFDHKQKYLIHNKDRLTYVKLRLRDSNEWSHILKNAINLDVTIIKDYVRETLPLGRLYKKFKQSYLLPVNFIPVIQSDRFFNFYLSPGEQIEYLNSLREKTTDQAQEFSRTEYKVYDLISEQNQSIPDVEIQHYFDDGCVCQKCTMMRKLVLKDIQNGAPPRSRLSHSDIITRIQGGPAPAPTQPNVFQHRQPIHSQRPTPTNERRPGLTMSRYKR